MFVAEVLIQLQRQRQHGILVTKKATYHLSFHLKPKEAEGFGITVAVSNQARNWLPL